MKRQTVKIFAIFLVLVMCFSDALSFPVYAYTREEEMTVEDDLKDALEENFEKELYAEEIETVEIEERQGIELSNEEDIDPLEATIIRGDISGDEEFGVVTWELENGVLRVIGESSFGSVMISFPNALYAEPPWEAYKDEIVRVEFEGYLLNIGANAFRDCKNLTEIVIPNGIKYIDKSAFFGDVNIQKIYLPTSLTSIHQYAFGCNNDVYKNMRLMDVYYGGTEDQWKQLVDNIDIGNDLLTSDTNAAYNAGIYFNSNTKLSTPVITNISSEQGGILIEWGENPSYIGNKILWPDSYEVYMNHVGSLDIQEQWEVCTPKWVLTGKTLTNSILLSSDEFVAGDEYHFRVRAIAAGEGSEFWAEPYTYTCPAQNAITVDYLAFSQSSYSVQVDDAINVSLEVIPENAEAVFTWKSVDPSIATLVATADGRSAKIKGIKQGATTVTVSTLDGSKSASLEVNVVGSGSIVSDIKVESVYLYDEELELVKGSSWTLEQRIYPTNATNQNVTWSSSNKSVATVDAYGKVKAVAPGTATITVKTADGGYTAKCVVTVKDSESTPTPTSPDIHVSGVRLGKTELDLEAGESSLLDATVSPENATKNSVTWSSSDEDVATVDKNGKVTAVASGKAIIIVKTDDGDYTDKCWVTVTESAATPTPTPTPSASEPGETELKEDAQGRIVYYKDGIAQMSYTGLVNADNDWYYVQKGIWTKEKTGYVDYEGAKFYVKDGVLDNGMNGVMIDPDSNPLVWYFNANGQVQTQHKGLAEYDGEWFYIEKGKVAVEMNKFVEYDGGLFAVAAGRIVREYSGLMQDPNGTDWYFLANGQVQKQYTGLAQYDGKWFYVEKGRLSKEYLTMVDYDGSQFCSEYGMIVEFESISPADGVIALINYERMKQGLNALQKKDSLCAAAQTRAVELSGPDSYSGTRPNGSNWKTVLDEYGVKGEAIELKANGDDTARAVASGWMNAQAPRKYILDGKYEYIGVGTAKNEANSKYYWELLLVD